MKYLLLTTTLLILFFSVMQSQDTLKIQEDTLGLCTYDGVIVRTYSTSTGGWTGPGFIDAKNGIGVSISWEILVPVDSTYLLTWRYSFGGTATNYRDGRLVVDGNVVIDTVFFPYTGGWNIWSHLTPLSIPLTAGDHKIRLEAVRTGGLANIDYFLVIGNKPEATVCTPQYTVNVNKNNSDWGTVSYLPVRNYYDKGTLVTLKAQANPGYFFESWTGEETSNSAEYTFAIKSNVNAVARFLPNDITHDTTIIGYATVQDDKGTTYLITGGALGSTSEASTLSDLQSLLGDTLPRVVKFTGDLSGNAKINIKSNKTLIGVGTAHLRGIALSINQARNIIVRNITISKVRDTLNTNDAFEINGGSKNIVIDHCELFSDRDHGKDYYDGLLDIKNGSTFITVAWTSLHDHYKACLISSGDDQYIDTVARITFHHNYFFNIESRLPLIRFGKAHIFNNYYKNCSDAINTRMGACVRVEKNYFENVGKAVFSDYSPILGNVYLIDNHFGSSSFITSPISEFTPPYSFTPDPKENVPSIVMDNIKLTSVNQPNYRPTEFKLEQNFPNPFNPATTINYQLSVVSNVTLKIYDLLGREVVTLVNGIKEVGYYNLTFDAARIASGIYFAHFTATPTNGQKPFKQVRKLLLTK